MLIPANPQGINEEKNGKPIKSSCNQISKPLQDYFYQNGKKLLNHPKSPIKPDLGVFTRSYVPENDLSSKRQVSKTALLLCPNGDIPGASGRLAPCGCSTPPGAQAPPVNPPPR